jgi:hypothetical protein
MALSLTLGPWVSTLLLQFSDRLERFLPDTWKGQDLRVTPGEQFFLARQAS